MLDRYLLVYILLTMGMQLDRLTPFAISRLLWLPSHFYNIFTRKPRA